MGSTEQLPKMQYRFLGRSGLQVSVISLGGWVTYGGSVGDQLAMDCMKAAFDAGVNFFDCAEGEKFPPTRLKLQAHLPT
jgi:predicted aldo/keto reductase-like oxidoreductase